MTDLPTHTILLPLRSVGAFAAALFIALQLVSCGGSDESSPAEPASTAATPSGKLTTFRAVSFAVPDGWTTKPNDNATLPIFRMSTVAREVDTLTPPTAPRIQINYWPTLKEDFPTSLKKLASSTARSVVAGEPRDAQYGAGGRLKGSELKLSFTEAGSPETFRHIVMLRSGSMDEPVLEIYFETPKAKEAEGATLFKRFLDSLEFKK